MPLPAPPSSKDSLTLINTQEFLPPVSRWVTFGSWFIVAALGSAIAASFAVQYRTTVKADAVVRPAGEPRLVQSAVTGAVVAIPVANNQPVKKGEVIAQLDISQLETRAVQLLANLEQGKNRLAQVQAQLASVEQQILAEKAQAERAIAAAAAEFEQARRTVQTEGLSAQASVQEVQAQITLAAREAESFSQLVESGAVSRLQLAEKQAALASAEARLAGLEASLNPSTGSVQAAQARVSQARAQGVSTVARLQQSQQQLVQQGLEIQEQLQRTEQELAQVTLEVDNATVRSPINGVLHELSLRNTGQVINPGETVAKVIPAEAPIQIKAMVPAGEINKVSVGLSAQMRVSACPFSEFGTVSGEVRAISPDTVTPASAASDNSVPTGAANAFYQVTIEADTPVLKSASSQRLCELQPGTEGRVTIISKEETVMTFLKRKAGLLTNF